MSQWLPELESIRWFSEHFGGEAFLAVSWNGCDVEDDRIAAMRSGLRKVNVASVEPSDPPEVPALRRIFDGRQIVEELEGLGYSKESAKRRLEGWIVGKESAATCLVLSVTQSGWTHRHELVDSIYRIGSELGISAQELHIGGPIRDSVAVDRMGLNRVIPLALVSVVLAIGITYFCIRQLSLVIAVICYATLCWMLALSNLPWFGTKLDSVLIAMPALVYVLAVSSAVHLTGYLQDSTEKLTKSRRRGLLQALWMGFGPCTIASFTTVLGLISLSVSEMKPVREFGIYSAAGVAVAWVALFLVWPTVVAIVVALTGKREVEPGQVPVFRLNGEFWWQPVFRFTMRYRVAIALVCALAVPFLLRGLAKLETSVRVSDLFSSSSDIHQDYLWFEQEIGGLVPLEIVLELDAAGEDSYRLTQNLVLLEKLRRFVSASESVTSAVSATTFLPPISQRSGFQGTIERRFLAAKLK
ncbi:MAG: hypothetical protein AAF483_00085 [Planctomycetota bacterium]